MSAFLKNGRTAAWHHVSRFHWFFNRSGSIPSALADLELLEAAVQQTRTLIVKDMRQEGCSWQEVGEALGMSKQGAAQRYRNVTE